MLHVLGGVGRVEEIIGMIPYNGGMTPSKMTEVTSWFSARREGILEV